MLGFIFGVLGISANLVAYVMVSTANYYFLFLYIAGIVFGILAIVFGMGGVSKFKKGNKNVGNLIFGIVGALLGIASCF